MISGGCVDISDKIDNEEKTAVEETAVSRDESRKHLAKNTISNVLFFIFNFLTSFYMVPFQIKHLGVEAFGMIGLANAFISYSQIITIALTGSTYRFVGFYAAKGENEITHKYFSTMFNVSLWLSILIILFSGVFTRYLPNIVRIPVGLENPTKILFLLVYISFAISLPMSAYQVSVFIRQRFDLRNLLDVFNQIFRYSTWLIAFTITIPSLIYIGAGYVFGTVAALCGSIYFFYKLTPNLHPNLKVFDKTKFIETTKTGIWMTITQIGVILYLSIDLYIINLMIGPKSVGFYNSILGLSMQLRVFSGLMSNMMTPYALACLAQNDYEGLAHAGARAVRLASLGIAIPLGVLCGLSKPFLGWWLGSEFTFLSSLIWLMLPHLIINLGVQPLFGISYAANKVMVPGIATLIGGLFKLGLAITLVKYTSLGFYGVALAGLISLTLKNAIFTPIYTAIVLKIPSLPLFMAIIPSALVFTLTALGAWSVTLIFNIRSLPSLLLSSLFIGLCIALLTHKLLLSSDDRDLFLKIIKRS